MTHPGCFQFFQFSGGLVQVVAVKVLADGPLAGKKLSDFRIHLPKVDVRVGIIFKDDKPIYPTGDTVVEVDDEVYFIATEENMRFMSELRKVDVGITRLRQKIEEDPKNPKYLQTIRGSGYVLWIE